MVGRNEDGKETEEMVGPENRDTANGYQVMCIVTSLDVYSGVIFGIGLYARKLSYEVDRVGVAEDLRQGLDHVGVYACDSVR